MNGERKKGNEGYVWGSSISRIWGNEENQKIRLKRGDQKRGECGVLEAK